MCIKVDENLIMICGGVDEKNSAVQDLFFFNPINKVLEKASNIQLGLTDKFVGGA